jgi:galactose mutarotase-like enzyme
MQIIENNFLKVTINPLGAELVSLFNQENNTEYLWSANPEFWGKSSPVLFPIVGALRNNQFIYQDKTYLLPRHGFAREKIFILENYTTDSAVFLLTHDEETLKVYPFQFEFRLKYTLVGKALTVAYVVTNIGNETMYFSVGGHPAFAVPLSPETTYDDYALTFNETEDFARWNLAEGGLIQMQSTEFLKDTNTLPLTKALFYDDALVFKYLKSTKVTLSSPKTTHALQFDFDGFPFLGIWAAKNADFVCIEPWCGIADAENHQQELIHKEGIETLAPSANFERTWTVTLC